MRIFVLVHSTRDGISDIDVYTNYATARMAMVKEYTALGSKLFMLENCDTGNYAVVGKGTPIEHSWRIIAHDIDLTPIVPKKPVSSYFDVVRNMNDTELISLFTSMGIDADCFMEAVIDAQRTKEDTRKEISNAGL